MAAERGVDAIRGAFSRCKEAGRPAFIPYLTAGYPDVNETADLMMAMERGGADVIELGVPFSDPLADGPTIQAANQTALDRGFNLHKCIEIVGAARSAGLSVPLIVMGYANPFASFGEAEVVSAFREAGADGFIVVDLPIEEAGEFTAACEASGMCFVPLIAPTTTDARMAQIAARGSGYVYCVSVTGVTGARDELPPHLAAFLARARRHFALPLAVGFGLSTREHVRQVGALAEGAVMGSAVIKAVAAASTAAGRAAALEAFVAGVSGRDEARSAE